VEVLKETGKGWQEFWAEFFRIKHRQSIEGIRDFDTALVSHIIETANFTEGNRILDLACGAGDQALELARRGMKVVGVEIAHALVDYGNEIGRKANLEVKLIQGDMREERFSEEFDGCVVLDAFGFFDDEGNTAVLKVIESALKGDGRFYIYGPNPLKRRREKWKGWAKVEGGYLLMESDYDPMSDLTTDRFSYVTSGGELIKFLPKPEDDGFSVHTRFYTLSQMIGLVRRADLQFDSAYGSTRLPPEEYTVTSEHLVVVGRKPN